MVSSSFVVLLPGGSGFLGAPPKALPQVFLFEHSPEVEALRGVREMWLCVGKVKGHGMMAQLDVFFRFGVAGDHDQEAVRVLYLPGSVGTLVPESSRR